MSSTSIYFAVKKLFFLLEKNGLAKLKNIMFFSLTSSAFEIITASSIVILANVLSDPQKGNQYLKMLGFNTIASPGLLFTSFALIVGVIYLCKNGFSILEAIYQQFSIQKINYRFKKSLLKKYATINYSFYLTRNSSQIHAIVSSDVELTFTSGLTALSIFFSEFLIFIVLIAMIIYIQPTLAFYVFAIMSLLAFLVYKLFLPKFYKWGQEQQKYAIEVNKNLLQFFYAFKEIVLNGQIENFIGKFYLASKGMSKNQGFQNVGMILPRAITESIFIIIFVFTVAFFSLNGGSPQQMIGALGGYLYIGFRLMPGLNRMITQINLFKSIIPSITRVYEEYTQTASVANYHNYPDFDFKNQVSINKVNFCYLNQEKYTLKNIELTINKGECIGITGETGSGKSTLADIFLGLMEPTEGSVLIDNKYVAHSLQWHQRIGYVQQSFYLTDDTIEANIAFGIDEQHVDKVKIAEVINASQLKKLIAKLPLGAKTIIGERGIRLSGGERQRIAIARALYKDADVFVFDEATSALDNQTEEELMETIDSIRERKKTIIIIAHRLSTLKNCDRIVIIKEGEIEKIINYDELNSVKSIA